MHRLTQLSNGVFSLMLDVSDTENTYRRSKIKRTENVSLQNREGTLGLKPSRCDPDADTRHRPQGGGPREESSFCSVHGLEDVLGKTGVTERVTQTTQESLLVPTEFKQSSLATSLPVSNQPSMYRTSLNPSSPPNTRYGNIRNILQCKVP